MAGRVLDDELWAERDLLLQRLLDEEGLGEASPPIPRRADQGRAHMTRSQLRLWFLDQLTARHLYNVPTLIDLEGEPDVPLLERCLNQLVRRHEVLRTAYPAVGGRPEPVIAPSPDLHLALLDLAGLPGELREEEARRAVVEESRRSFDLGSGPLLRATLIRLSERRSRLLVVVHHIACDWWSVEVLVRELATLYALGRAGAEAVLPELPVQFSDFAAWQNDWLRQDRVRGQLAYWQSRLAGAPAPELRTDRPRPPVQGFAGRRFHFQVPEPVARALRSLCAASGVTLFTGALAVFGLLLARYADQDDIVVGTPVSGRGRSELEGLIGLFLNTLVLRLDLSGDPGFSELLERVHAVTLQALDNGDLPFEVLVDELRPVRDLSRTPLFQVLFSLFQLSGEGTAGGEMGLSREEVDFGISRFDLSLLMMESASGLFGVFEYSTDLFDAATVERLAGHFLNLLAAAVQDPRRRVSELTMLDPSERARILFDWNATAADYGRPSTLVELFERQAGRSPGAAAVVAEGETLTYRELDGRADRLARRLRRLGVGPGTIVGVCAERSAEMVAGLLGILKAGGAYLPLDPDHPDERLAYMVADAGCGVVLAQGRLVPRLPPGRFRVIRLDAAAAASAGRGAGADGPPVGPSDAAYVIYTSGSTGRPKGVVVEHAGIANRLLWMQEAYRLQGSDRVLQKTPFGFDVSVWEFFWPLLAGAALVMARPGGHRDPAYLVDVIAGQGITTVHFVPSMLQPFLEEPGLDRCRALRRVICSGEALPRPLQERFHQRLRAELHNLYGPTEASVDVTHWACSDGDGRGFVPIGRPIANIRVHVVDRHLQPVPVGVQGELLIGGVGLARGYLGRPGQTAERFIPDPFGPAGQRLYRSGDLARYHADGSLEFLGRRDGQVKLHGNRIELGEIEAVLMTHPAVREALVVLREDAPGDPRLAAYVVPEGRPPAGEELRGHLRARLPGPMVPSAFVSLERLPLTTNGKFDRRALPPPEGGRPTLEEPYVAPRNRTEQLLAESWAAVLEVERVGVHDNFFALGGDSLKTVRAVGLARERGLDVSVAQLFEHQTVAELAGRARALSEQAALPEPFGLVAAQDRSRLPQDVEDAYPMAMLQAGMLLHMDREAGAEAPAYHNVTTIKVVARFDSEALQRAVDQVVARHAALRTSLHVAGYSVPLQLVHRSARLPVTFEDARGLDQAEQGRALTDWMRSEARAPFDVTRAPLLRLHVHRTAGDSFWFTVTECHPILDGWSFTSIVSEVLRRYGLLLEGESPPAEAVSPPHQREFVRLEQAALASPEERAYWSERLSAWRPRRLPRRPASLPAPDDPASHRLYVPIGGDLAEGLERLAADARVPLNSVLLAAHLRVLSLLTGEREVVTGVVLHGRPELPDAEQARGLFLNVLPLGLRLEGGTWSGLVKEAHGGLAALLAHRHYPQAALQRAWTSKWGAEPMYEAAFNYTHFYAMEALERLPNLELASTFREIARTSVPLMANFERGLRRDGVAALMSLEAEGGVVGVEHLRRIADMYLAVLEAMARDPAASSESDRLPAPSQGSAAAAGPEAGRAPGSRSRAGTQADAAANGVREALAGAWAEVLKVVSVREDDDFFELGGDSILALQIVARLREAGLRLTTEAIFEHPTIAELAPLVVRVAAPAPLPAAHPAGLATAGLGPEELAAVAADVGVGPG